MCSINRYLFQWTLWGQTHNRQAVQQRGRSWFKWMEFAERNCGLQSSVDYLCWRSIDSVLSGESRAMFNFQQTNLSVVNLDWPTQALLPPTDYWLVHTCDRRATCPLLKRNSHFEQPGPYFFICFYLNEWWHFQFLQLLLTRLRVHQSFNFSGGPHLYVWGPPEKLKLWWILTLDRINCKNWKCHHSLRYNQMKK